MRKIKGLLIIMLIVAMIMATGCVGDKTTKENGTESSVTTTLLAGASPNKWFILGNGIAEALNRSYKGSVIHIAPGIPRSNMLKMNNNEVEFAIFHTDIAYEAYRGMGQFTDEVKNISLVAIFYPSVAHFVLRNDIGLTSFREFIDKKVPLNISVGRPEGSMDMAFSKILDYYGLTYDDLIAWGCNIYKKGFDDTEAMFENEAIDGFFIVAGAPTVFVTQLSINEEMASLEWEQDLLAHMCENYGFAQNQIEGDAYTFMDKEINTFCSYTMLGAAASASEETVYKMTKSIYENMDYIKSLHAALGDIDMEILTMGAGIPRHPGAEKYYKEIGLID